MNKIPRDDRAQMPFALVALILILISSLSAALTVDLREGSRSAELTVEEIMRMEELAIDAKAQAEGIAWQALLSTCTGELSNESTLTSAFRRELDGKVITVFPKIRNGLRAAVDVSGIELTFLRLPLYEGTTDASLYDSFIPAFVGLSGTIGTNISSVNGHIETSHRVNVSGMVPWPLLRDRMDRFENSVTGDLGDLSSMVNYLLESLAAYRVLQGWGGHIVGDGPLQEVITERDLLNAIDLSLVLLQIEHFRTASPCYDMATVSKDGQECWQFVIDSLHGGGSIDPADIFLGLYDYQKLDWRTVFAQALSSSVEIMSLRWMESIGIIDIIELAERTGEKVYTFTNELIERTFDVDLVEHRFKQWLEKRFEERGIPDTLYRYLGAGYPDGSGLVRSVDIVLHGPDGDEVPLQVGGQISLDIPTTDVMAWEGWGEFRDRYRKGTFEMLESMRMFVLSTAEQISRSMFLPITSLVLDPRDGLTFIDEIQSRLSTALKDRDVWVREALTAAEAAVKTMDPLAEATKREFIDNIDEILKRESAIRSMIREAAEQMLSIASDQSGFKLPIEGNLEILESAIINDMGWGAYDLIEETFERQSQFLIGHFLSGLDGGISHGTSNSWKTDLVARTGDPMIGISALLSHAVSDMLGEMSKGVRMRGNRMTIDIPSSSGFSLIGSEGRRYSETLRVSLSYPSSSPSHAYFASTIIDPRTFGADTHDVQTHDVNLLEMRTASYQSIWGISFSGKIDAKISVANGLAELIQMELVEELPVVSEQTVTVLSGHPLMDVKYVSINTIGQQIADVIGDLLRPLQDGLATISSAIRSMHRMVQRALVQLTDMGQAALERLNDLFRQAVERLQDFIRSTLYILETKVADTLLKILGERSWDLFFQGVRMNIKLRPKDMAFPGYGVPASFAISFGAGDCRIDVTTRLVKGQGNLSLLTNATLQGNDWLVCVVIDPFMDVFRHMVEVRGLVDGACIEMVMPEVVSYRKVSFALSDIPGVGMLLSNIPVPVPGLKGNVDAGIYLNILEGRADCIVINEYELNPAGDDHGKEWVELYNPTDMVIDLVGWTLETRHGVQSLSVLDHVLMPRSRVVYNFPGQALDNGGEGFPFEESIILRDEQGRIVDSTPFSTDHWNDGRTWQRAMDGADRWEFREGTKGRSNGRTVLSIPDLDPLQRAFFAAVTESLYQLSSGDYSMEALSITIETALIRLVERLASEILEKEIVAGVFVEVAVSEVSSTVKTGLRMEAMWRCGTMREALHGMARSARSLTSSFGNPFLMPMGSLPSADSTWLSLSSFGSLDLPKMISLPGRSISVRYEACMAVDLGTITALLAGGHGHLSMEAGAKVSGIPASAAPVLSRPYGTLLDVWLCKVTVQRMPR